MTRSRTQVTPASITWRICIIKDAFDEFILLSLKILQHLAVVYLASSLPNLSELRHSKVCDF